MKNIKLLFLLALLCAFSANLTAQSDYEKTKAEITKALGTFPSFMEAVPKDMLSMAWQHFGSSSNPNNKISAKYMELIKVSVAAQIPCDYCIHVHTINAKAAGATDEEIKEAVMHGAWVRHWSMVVNGAAIDFEEFKKEYASILDYLAKQSNK